MLEISREVRRENRSAVWAVSAAPTCARALLHGFGQLRDLLDEFAGRRQQSPKPNKCPYDLDDDLDRLRRPKHSGEHRHAVLGEDTRDFWRPPCRDFDIPICDIKSSNSFCVSKEKSKIAGNRSALRLTA
jgi:hypothetical protein